MPAAAKLQPEVAPAAGGGAGATTIPFALSDAKGEWRLVARDAATGVRTEATLTVR